MCNDQDLDKLIDELTIELVHIQAKTPPKGGWNHDHKFWSKVRWTVDGVDIAYYNRDGYLHRLFGPAYISKKYNVKIWYKDGDYHRIGGPAIQHKENFLWYKDGKLHNLDGPAIIDPAGPSQYWIDGQRYSLKEYKKEIIRRKRKGIL